MKGEFSKGKKHGQGIFSCKNGDSYEGSVLTFAIFTFYSCNRERLFHRLDVFQPQIRLEFKG